MMHIVIKLEIKSKLMNDVLSIRFNFSQIKFYNDQGYLPCF